MTARAVCSLLLCGALASCGGGVVFVDGSFAVFGNWPRAVTSEEVQLSGSAFVPLGATCMYGPGPFAPPGCTCEAGARASGQWTNSATGAAGALELTVLGGTSCTPIGTAWRTPGIALAPGANSISLSISDGTTRGGASVIVVRD